MAIDQQILSAAIADRKTFEAINDYVNTKDFSPPVGFWFDAVRDYYSRDRAAKFVEVSLLQALVVPAITNPKQGEALSAVLSGLPTASPGNVSELVLDLRKRNVLLELAAEPNGKKANKLFEELVRVWHRTELVEAKEFEYAPDWAELGKVIGRDKRISLGIPSLDSRIGGGVLPGHHILVFGRTEIGKSCLTIALSANLIRHGQSRLLYVGNEDEIAILKGRMGQSLLGWTSQQMESMPKKAARLLSELTQDRLVMVKVTPGSISELEDLTAKHAPSILVVDQIRNLSGPEEGMTQKMEHNAIRFRSLLSREHLIGISVTQAGDRSQGHNQEGPLYLSPGDVDSSRVGLPGTADLQLGIGTNREMMLRGLRMISFAKNKLSSETNSREPLLVRFDLARSQVKDAD